MAKKKVVVKELECKDCRHSTLINSELYCQTKLKDKDILTDYAKANKTFDCLFYKFRKV